jgi:steroid 5-alpha reductase family enzyme
MPEASSIFGVAVAGLGLSLALACLTWVASLVRHDVSLVDRVWSLLVAGPALLYFALLPAPGARGACMVALAIAWALRLGLYVTWRNWGHGEDRRYQEIRNRNEPNFALKSLYLVFALQAVLAWVVSTPFLAGMASSQPMNWLDFAGLALAAFGIVFEGIGDLQMSRFKGDPSSRGKVMDQGLWRFTRHPNYFGEACVWWGLWPMAMAGAGWAGAWSAISPALMTVLLLKISGVRLLEKDIAERRPDYRDYILRTNAFVPGPPHRKSP